MTTLCLKDFDYILPENLIARYPLAERSASRLLYLPASQPAKDEQFIHLPTLLKADDLIVFNDTKVMKARLFGQKQSGGKVEVLVEKILTEDNGKAIFQRLAIQEENKQNIALCHIRASKAPKVGTILLLADNNLQVEVIGREENLFIVKFYQPILENLEKYGELPIPPYFERHADSQDDNRYQTVFHDPKKLASVASPTASLHFDDKILQQLLAKGVKTAFVTLHVGAGTFAPVKTEDILQHKMHSEYAELSSQTAELINQTKAKGGRIIAVGTTVTRVLESAYLQNSIDGQLRGWAGETDIFIYPSFKFQVVDCLITNFHLPKSTLLMLVSAFAGQENIRQAYQYAIKHQYRFFSYGDAMFLEKNAE